MLKISNFNQFLKAMEQKRFSFSMPIVKAYISKTTGKKVLEGVASTTDKDLHGDRMSPQAIQTMADSIKQLKKKHGTLNAEHDKSWMSELGDITDLEVDKNNKLVMTAELDNSPLADTLWYKLTEQKKKLGLSIGGFVKSFRIEIDEKTKEYMRVFEDIVLDHIAVVSQPANPNTYVSAIAKSVNGIQPGVGADQEEEVELNLLNNQEEMTTKKAQDTELEKNEQTQEEVSEGQATEVEETATEGQAEETSTEESAEEVKTEEAPAEQAEESKEEAPAEEAKEEVAEEKAEEVKEESTTEETEVDKTEPEQEEKSFATKTDLSEMEARIMEAMKSLVAKGTEESAEQVEEKKEEAEAEAEEAKEEAAETEEVEKSALEKDVEALKSKVEAMEKVAVTKRKTATEADKFGEDENAEVSKSTMDAELAEIEKKFAGDPDKIFAEKGAVRRKYAALGIK